MPPLEAKDQQMVAVCSASLGLYCFFFSSPVIMKALIGMTFILKDFFFVIIVVICDICRFFLVACLRI